MKGSCEVSANAVAFFGQGAKGMCLYLISTKWKRYEAKGQGLQACKDRKESDQLQPSALLRKKDQPNGGCRKKLTALRLDMDLNQKPR